MKLKIGSKSGLRYFDYKYLKSIDPCYSPSRYIGSRFRGTALDILNHNAIPAQDKLWVVLRTDLVSEELMRLFAVWACRRSIKLLANPDPRIEACCVITEKFALGKATEEERSAAESEAWSAAKSAASPAAEYAYWSAAESAASSAARSAAWSAARSAAWSVACSTAESAAESAAESTARSAAWSAAWSAQIEKLKEMVIAEGLERVALKRGK